MEIINIIKLLIYHKIERLYAIFFFKTSLVYVGKKELTHQVLVFYYPSCKGGYIFSGLKHANLLRRSVIYGIKGL